MQTLNPRNENGSLRTLSDEGGVCDNVNDGWHSLRNGKSSWKILNSHIGIELKHMELSPLLMYSSQIKSISKLEIDKLAW